MCPFTVLTPWATIYIANSPERERQAVKSEARVPTVDWQSPSCSAGDATGHKCPLVLLFHSTVGSLRSAEPHIFTPATPVVTTPSHPGQQDVSVWSRPSCEAS